MSYETMFLVEDCCDFPGCGKSYYKKPKALVALERKGEIQAFCQEHSERLIREGIQLFTLAELHAARKQAREAKLKEQQQQRQTAAETAFIDQLRGL